MAVVYSSAAESALDLYSETFWDSSLVSAMSLAFSVRRGGGDLLADFLLLGASLFEGLQRLTTCGVGGEHFVDELHGLAALALGFLDDIGVFTDELNIQSTAHQTSRVSRHRQWPNARESRAEITGKPGKVRGRVHPANFVR